LRYLVISDIHANLPAFQTALFDAPDFDAIWCLGDIVGYGPNPNQCIEILQEHPHICVIGNHDWGALGRTDPFVFNSDAREALLWTQRELNADSRAYLSGLSTSVNVEEFLLVHGSPREPIWEYLLDAERAKQSFLTKEFQVAFVGHTHIPMIFEWLDVTNDARLLLPDLEEPIKLNGRRLILNPGSVGQPRDGNPRAAYGLLDTDEQTFEFRRVAYPIEITQERMRARALPNRLIDRLEMGR
jgi:predicted phosphodiesterase